MNNAAACSSTLEEAAFVAAFAASSYESTAIRVNKPFNPMLGETFECDRRAEHGWRVLFEQVRRERERERENIQVHVCKKSQQMLEAREKRKDKFLTDFCVNLIIFNFMCCILNIVIYIRLVIILQC